MQTACRWSIRWAEKIGTMLVCWSCARVCDSVIFSAETFSATGRSARSPWLARNTRPNAPRPSSLSRRNPRNVSPGLGRLTTASASLDAPFGSDLWRSANTLTVSAPPAARRELAQLSIASSEPPKSPMRKSRYDFAASARSGLRRLIVAPNRSRPAIDDPPSQSSGSGQPPVLIPKRRP